MNIQNRPIEVLLVEDNPGDVRLTRETFTESGARARLHVVGDGVEALAFLRRQGPYTGAARPDMILLDLNMPRMDGREVLTEIKRDPDLRRIPVIVLTTSQTERDILKSYDLQANSYITKPVDLDHFLTVVKVIDSFWFKIARLPSSED